MASGLCVDDSNEAPRVYSTPPTCAWCRDDATSYPVEERNARYAFYVRCPRSAPPQPACDMWCPSCWKLRLLVHEMQDPQNSVRNFPCPSCHRCAGDCAHTVVRVEHTDK